MPAKSNRKSSRNVSKEKHAVSANVTAQSKPGHKIKEHNRIPFEIQRMILNVFETAFPVLANYTTLQENIQKVKGHLFNRDFITAFGEQANLEAYAVRWSAARSLAYTSIFSNECRASVLHGTSRPHNDSIRQVSESGPEFDELKPEPASSASDEPLKSHIVCIGGGAGAEIVSLAATHTLLNVQRKFVITAIDIADWSIPVSRLATALSEPPELSAHASEVAKARPENHPLLLQASSVDISFEQQNILTWDVAPMKQTLEDADLCTIMFTLNELFSTSIQKTTSFLLNLTSMVMPGTHLLIVDSPGSYSEIQLQSLRPDQEKAENQEPTKKRYPMKWLLDHTLLTVAKNNDQPVWDKLEDEESLWFRIDAADREKLRYPLELENMRYQLHLYRRLGNE